MISIRRLWVFLAVPLASSCIPNSGSTPAAATAKVSTSPLSTDIGKLGRSIALPRRPLSAVWQQTTMGDGSFGPADYTIQAVMRFSPRDLQALTASATKRAPARPGVIPVQPWFPDPLKNKAKSKGGLRAQSLDPSGFTKMSLIHGEMWRIEGTNTLFVSLFTS